MKIDYLLIENYGCIDKIEYVFKNNVPLVLIGQNGSGKSLVLSNIVDALILYKKEKYTEGILEVKGSNYFKIGKKQYIKFGKTYSKCVVKFDNKDVYMDAMSYKNDTSIFTSDEISIIEKNKFRDNGFTRTVTHESVKDFDNDCYLYFPVDRFYIPSWQNAENYTKIIDNFSSKSIGYSNTNIIKNNIGDNLKQWLYRVFSVRKLFPLYGSADSYVVENNYLQKCIIQIIQIIKGSNWTINILNRKNDNIPLSNGNNIINDINSLSSGEMMMFGMFVSIIKEYDIYYDNFSLDDIKGICIIDEIDLNLHISQQKEALPKLIGLFPGMQFIITTHSPFFVKGMHDIFKENVDFMSMPSGKLLNDLVDFAEIEETIKAFGQEGEELLEKINNLKTIVEKLEEENKIILITEGKTDAKYLEKAYEKLGLNHPKFTIIGNGEVEGTDGGDLTLKNFLISQKCLGAKAPKIIAMFDSDNKDIKNWIEKSGSEIIPGRIYAFCIPIPIDRIGEENISIEHYFKDEELRTLDGNLRLFQAGEFLETGIHSDETKFCEYLVKNKKKIEANYILSGSGDKKTTDFSGNNLSLSKNEFCENVMTDKAGFDKFDFSKFKQIIDKINLILTKII